METLCSPSRNPGLASSVLQSLPGALVPAAPGLATCPTQDFPIQSSSPLPSPLGSAALLCFQHRGPEPSASSPNCSPLHRWAPMEAGTGPLRPPIHMSARGSETMPSPCITKGMLEGNLPFPCHCSHLGPGFQPAGHECSPHPRPGSKSRVPVPPTWLSPDPQAMLETRKEANLMT